MFNTLEEAENFGRDLAKEVKAAIEQRCAALEIKIGRLESALAEKSSVKYMGVHRPGATYSAGSLVTRDGSIFHCNKNTTAIPGDGSMDWTLAVKKGRDAVSR